ncbi:LPS-induced tumor necrosis factor alpha factor [Fusarium oxysporum f. sp. vasinfectum]|nr:LPS-induced tumor necrosis factor alpha factor [Fusarium oxysporum f. sp. vasinfectum]
MEKPTPNLKHHQHHAHHSLEHDNQQPSGYKSRDFSSPLEPKLEEQDLPSVPIHKLQSLSAPVVCPKCGVRAMTITRVKSGSFTLALAGIAMFFISVAIVKYLLLSGTDVVALKSSPTQK